MRLEIDGQWHDLTPLAEFKAQYGLPNDFGVAFFEPKDYTGLARIDGTGDALQQLFEDTLAAVPPVVQWADLFAILAELRFAFQKGLESINTVIGLRPVEIEFAVSGFHDLCQLLGYELVRLQALKQPLFQRLPETVYSTWLNTSVRISSKRYTYSYDKLYWQIQVLNTLYGRVGLVVALSDGEVRYIQDKRGGCPADHYMFRLFIETANTLIQRLNPDGLA